MSASCFDEYIGLRCEVEIYPTHLTPPPVVATTVDLKSKTSEDDSVVGLDCTVPTCSIAHL